MAYAFPDTISERIFFLEKYKKIAAFADFENLKSFHRSVFTQSPIFFCLVFNDKKVFVAFCRRDVLKSLPMINNENTFIQIEPDNLIYLIDFETYN